MAPFRNKPVFKGQGMTRNTTKDSAGFKKKTWTQENKFFHGSVQEGLGFAWKRKQKVQRKYERYRRNIPKQKSSLQANEDYPEHLKHLYKAEEERMMEEEQLNQKRRKRSKGGTEEEEEEEDIMPSASSGSGYVSKPPEEEPFKKSATVVQEDLQTSQSGPQRRKWNKMSSYQKMQAEYEKRKEEQERKKQEFLKEKAEREEALKKYKEKKMETYKLLKKKTKKGQPNLNLQMELLLQKIQTRK